MTVTNDHFSQLGRVSYRDNSYTYVDIKKRTVFVMLTNIATMLTFQMTGMSDIAFNTERTCEK
jgi:hypothetical protein